MNRYGTSERDSGGGWPDGRPVAGKEACGRGVNRSGTPESKEFAGAPLSGAGRELTGNAHDQQLMRPLPDREFLSGHLRAFSPFTTAGRTNT